jgi:hypothetical protein
MTIHRRHRRRSLGGGLSCELDFASGVGDKTGGSLNMAVRPVNLEILLKILAEPLQVARYSALTSAAA